MARLVDIQQLLNIQIKLSTLNESKYTTIRILFTGVLYIHNLYY